MDAQISSWIATEGRLRNDLDLGGVYSFLQVHTGEEAWQVDQNGKLSPIEGSDLRDLLTSGYVANWSMLRLPPAGQIELLDPSDDGPVVRCTPEGGKPVTFYLDQETGLPLRWEMPQQERVALTVIEGWQESGGILFPAAWSESTGDPQYEMQFRLHDVTLHQQADPVWFSKPEEELADVVFLEEPPLRNIPIELNTVHIFVQGSVNGSSPLWWVLDTGASVTVLNRLTAERLGLEMQGSIEGRGAGEKTTEVNLIGGVTFSMPGVELRDQTVAAIDLEQIEKLIGRQLDGILGYDFISRFVVELDYAQRQMHLHDRSSWSYDGEGQVVPIELEGSQPHVSGRLILNGRDPIEGRYLIDTGASGQLHLARPFTEKHALTTDLERSYEHSGGFGVGGRSRSIVGRIDAFELGALRFPGPVCAFSRDERGAHADPNAAGLIGGQILERCRVFFDYERGSMILEPESNLEAPFAVDSLGLQLITGGRDDFHAFSVIGVVEGSPADRAGLREGDELRAFDGKPMVEWTVDRLWRHVQSLNADIEIEFERDGEPRRVIAHCAPML
jgi:predicted aspartyl protease